MKIKLNVSAYVGDGLALAGSIHDLKNGAELIEKGIATAVSNEIVEATDAPTNEEIIDGLILDDEEKAYLIENIGEFQLELKVDGSLNKKSSDKANEILDGMED